MCLSAWRSAWWAVCWRCRWSRRWFGSQPLPNEHAVAVTEKPVPLAHRFTVSFQNQFPTRERAHEHQQRGLRQMEIRQQRVHHAKLERRTDEQIGTAFAGGLVADEFPSAEV